MALLHESVHSKKFDIRLIERNIARGVVSHQELKEVVQALPDDSENADWISIEELADDGSSRSYSDEPPAHLSNGKAPH